METLLVDTNKLRESGYDILGLSNEFNEELNSLYMRISNMNVSTNGWIGQGAKDFIRIANLEKIQYLKIKKLLDDYGKILISAATYYETEAKKRAE